MMKKENEIYKQAVLQHNGWIFHWTYYVGNQQI